MDFLTGLTRKILCYIVSLITHSAHCWFELTEETPSHVATMRVMNDDNTDLQAGKKGEGGEG